MGRGRARAKQTRVARDLKYRSIETDFAELERELQGAKYDDDYDEVDDPYAHLAAQYNDFDDEDEHRA